MRKGEEEEKEEKKFKILSITHSIAKKKKQTLDNIKII